MKQIVFSIICFFAFSFSCFAKAAETFDIATFQPRKGWQRQEKGGVIIFNTSDTQKGTYAMITLFASGTSAGSAKSDFEGDWAEFIAGQFGVKVKPDVEPIEKKDGWDLISGGAAFENEMGPSAVVLSTYSGFGKTFSAAAIFNSQGDLPAIEAFAASLKVKNRKPGNKLRVIRQPVSKPKLLRPVLLLPPATSMMAGMRLIRLTGYK